MSVLLALFAAIVLNGDFENGEGVNAPGWSFSEKGKNVWRVEPGAGFNGNRGLVWECAATNIFTFPVQEIRFTPGKRYRFAAQIKTCLTTLTKRNHGAGLFLSWYDAQGRLGGEFYTIRIRGTNDWAKVENVTRTAIPKEAVRLTVSPFVHRGCSGWAAFDDISVSEYEQKPLGALQSSAYRDIANEGTVRFFAPLFVETNGFDSAGWKVCFEYAAADGTRRTVPADVMGPTFVAMSVRVDELAMGEQTVKCSLSSADGKTADSAVLKFSRVAALPPRKVYVDSGRRLIVDGKPFFPIGMYASVLRPPVVREYVKGPFNCILPYNRPTKAQLDMCDKRGMKVIFPVYKIYSGWRSVPKGIKTLEDERRYLSDFLSYAKGHPAMLAWYIADELSVVYVPRMVERSAWLAAEDPDHPTFAMFCRYDQMREYLPSADILGTDVYPVPKGPLRRAADITRVTDESLFGSRHLWQAPQAFAWNSQRYRNPRFPTREEMRSMSWQMIASGANGLIAYALHNCMDRHTGESIDGRWEAVCEIYSEIERFTPMLLAGDEPPALHGVSGSLAVRTFREGNTAYALVCNLEGTAAATEFSVDGACSDAKVLFGLGVSGGTDGVLKVSMPPYGVCIAEFDMKKKNGGTK